jgi:hypothetical protein
MINVIFTNITGWFKRETETELRALAFQDWSSYKYNLTLYKKDLNWKLNVTPTTKEVSYHFNYQGQSDKDCSENV